MKTTKKKFFQLILILSQVAWVGCVDDSLVVQNYYTFTGETAASYLTDRESEFSGFMEILKRAGLFDQLSTYGEYTCFAPNNDAIQAYLSSKNRASVSDLSDAECDTIAKTHLIDGLYYTTDLEEGAISATNYLGRYLMYSTASVSDSDDNVSVAYYINKTAEMIVRDDSVENGVVHTLNAVVTSSNQYLPQLMAQDTTISIFVTLLQKTGLDKKLEKYLDETYSVGSDSITLGSFTFESRDASYPETRKYGYTAFVEPNAVYRSKGAKTAQDVIDKLISKSGNFYTSDPNGRYTYDNNYTDSTNVVYRFVAYHLLDRLGNYSQWNVSSSIRENQAVYDLLDPQDFYESMCPFSMIKFQTTREGLLYINRRRINEGAAAVSDAADPYQAAVSGVRVYTATEAGDVDQSALNGVYHYINDLLIYNDNTADVLNTRFRIDASTLSPDFLNNPGRHRTKSDGSRYLVTCYKPGFVTNFTFTDQTLMGLRNDPLDWSPSYQCDGLDFLGQYDFTVKLPPVPEGQYEIRLGMNASADRGIVQVYLDDSPCGIPIDMRIYKSDPKIGAVDDTEDEEENSRNDKDLRNRGYMKGPDSWKTANLEADQVTLRAYYNSMRIILATEKLNYGEEHYLRFKSVIDNEDGLFPFDYLELCPKSVYGNTDGEDTH